MLVKTSHASTLTTFSTFAVEVAGALRSEDLSGAFGYTVLSVVGRAV